MMILKNIFVIFLIVILLIGATGCMQKNNKKIDRKTLITYMENKYDDNFTYVGSYGGSLDGSSMNLLLKSEKLNGEEVKICYYENSKGAFYADNYMKKKYSKQTVEKFSDIVKPIFGTEVLITIATDTGVVNQFTKDTTFEEFIQSTESNIRLILMVSPRFTIDDHDLLVDELRERLLNSKMFCGGSIYFVDTEENYKDFSVVPVGALEDMECLKFSMNKANKSLKLEWR